MKVATLILLLEQKKNSIAKEKKDNTRFRTRGYDVVINKLRQSFDLNNNITPEMLDQITITKHMQAKLTKWIKEDRKPEKQSEKETLINKLTALIGIGRVKAKQLIANGLTKITDLKKEEFFNELPYETQIDIQYAPVKRIPHKVMEEVEKMIADDYKKAEIIFVGSFRRNTLFSRDFDIMIVNGDTDDYLKYMKKKLGSKNVVIFQKGVSKLSGLLIYKENAYKFDAFVCKQEHRIPMLLYSTGSKANNIKMRNIAKKKGMILNQYGLFKRGKALKVESEEDIFHFLGMEYLKPEDR
jgi:DNA polymerase/3'-5' exonuclease PolX